MRRQLPLTLLILITLGLASWTAYRAGYQQHTDAVRQNADVYNDGWMLADASISYLKMDAKFQPKEYDQQAWRQKLCESLVATFRSPPKRVIRPRLDRPCNPQTWTPALECVVTCKYVRKDASAESHRFYVLDIYTRTIRCDLTGKVWDFALLDELFDG